jgi:hypothetical protein
MSKEKYRIFNFLLMSLFQMIVNPLFWLCCNPTQIKEFHLKIFSIIKYSLLVHTMEVKEILTSNKLEILLRINSMLMMNFSKINFT